MSALALTLPSAMAFADTQPRAGGASPAGGAPIAAASRPAHPARSIDDSRAILARIDERAHAMTESLNADLGLQAHFDAGELLARATSSLATSQDRMLVSQTESGLRAQRPVAQVPVMQVLVVRAPVDPMAESSQLVSRSGKTPPEDISVAAALRE